jgi:hypothetical protein
MSTPAVSRTSCSSLLAVGNVVEVEGSVKSGLLDDDDDDDDET